MASSSSSNDGLDRAIMELRHQCSNEEEWRTCSGESPGLLGVGRLTRRLLLVLLPRSIHEEQSEDHHTLYIALYRLIDELEHWRFLTTFLSFIYKCTDSQKVMQNLRSLINRIEAASDEIVRELRIACRYKSIPKVLDVLYKSERTMELFKPQLREALLDPLSGSGGCCSLKFQFSLLHYSSLWLNFTKSVQVILIYIWAQLDAGDHKKKIKALESNLGYFFSQVQVAFDELRFAFLSSTIDHHRVIQSFFTHVASLAVRVAYQSLSYWISKTVLVANSKITGLLDLQHESDPTTSPELLELNVNFLRTLNKIRPGRDRDLANLFLGYLFGGRREYSLHRELMPLMIFVIDEPLEESGEHVHSFLAEIIAMLRVAGDISREHMERNFRCSELHARICLLKAEVFLKERLKSSILLTEGQTKELKKILKKLKKVSKHLPQEKIENGKQALELVNQVAGEVTSLCQSFHVKATTKDKIRISLFILILKIVFFKAESSFMELLNGNASLIALANDKIQTLLEGLELFISFVSNQDIEMAKVVEPIFIHIEAVLRRITPIYYSFLVKNVREEMIEKMVLLVPDCLDKMMLIKLKLREICPQFPRSNFPMTDGMGFIDFLLANLLELLKHDPSSIGQVKHHIEEIRLDLELLRSFSMNVLQPDTEHPELKDVVTHITSVAYEVEYVIDSIEVGIGAHWQHLFWISDLLEEIRCIKTKATKIYTEKTCDVRALNVSHISRHIVSQPNVPETDEVVVCLSDQEEVIIDQLTRGSSHRDVVSIVGMPGIGKTTLAHNVYNDPRVAYYFHIRAWCSVSQVYGKRELLLDILSDTGGLTDNMSQITDEDLDLKLYQRLKQKRYLIVMDDVWDTGAWNDLERSFPDDENGSRILMTSRLHDVALKAKAGYDPHQLRLLSDDESWKLLQMKIFRGSCPGELLGVGEEIAKNCKGLPLAIVAIAGLLERAENKQERWKKIAENLSSQIIDDPQTRCKDILQLSYKHLPDNLQACFLYLGAFLEDKDILVRKLIRLWIAEGFIRQTGLKSSEELAEDYLKDLIDRSLITVSRKRSNGMVKACRIHDMLRDLCLSKAKEENFLQLVTGYDEPYASFDNLDYGSADFYDYYPSNHVTCDSHRLCICLKRKYFVQSSPSGPRTRSLIFFATSDTYPRRPYDLSFISHHFKLLRVLDLENINMGTSFPVGIESLVQLRYLALSGDIDSIPPSIANLWKLETLILKGLKGKVVLPGTILQMARLRHIHIKNHVDINFLEYDLGSSSQLDNLVTFSLLSLSYQKDTIMIIRRIPNLRKLGCIFVESMDSSGNSTPFPRLDFLFQLESLKIFYFGRIHNPSEFILPLNLKKLTLSNFRLPWHRISAVGRLQNLEVLKLLSRAFEGERWDMTEGEFLNLKFLKLDTLNIAQWNASNDHLPNLQQLILRNCKVLEEVPYTFAEIPTLQMIEVQFCGKSTEDSVRNIAEEGIEGLKIIINHKIHI